MVCLLCIEKIKEKVPRQITNNSALLKHIQQLPKYENYSPEDCKLPKGCCSRCYSKIQRKKQLPIPAIDSNDLKFPLLPSKTRRGDIENLQHCECSICSIGRKNCTDIGYKTPKKSSSTSDDEPDRCGKCLNKKGRSCL